MSVSPWPLISSSGLKDYRIFKIRSDEKKSPRTGKTHEFIVINAGDWVNVVAVTGNNELVMIEQYRHGTNTIELEIPGGVLDSTDDGPIEGGIRELQEETGYEGTEPRMIGKVFSNPAIMNNTCYTVLFTDCRLLHPTSLDQGEDIVVRLIPVDHIRQVVADGKIRHSLVIAALYYYDLIRQGL